MAWDPYDPEGTTAAFNAYVAEIVSKNSWLNDYPDRDKAFNPANSGYNIGPGQFKTYDQLYAEGLGRPQYNSGIESGLPGTFSPNQQMLAKYGTYDAPESFFAPFMGALQDLGPFLAMTSIGGGLAGAGWGGLGGDIWSGLTGTGTTPNLGIGNSVEAGSMEMFNMGGGTPTNGATFAGNGGWTGAPVGNASPFSPNYDFFQANNPMGSGGSVPVEALRDLSTLPSPTNLQTLMTQLDSTSAGKTILNTITGGGTDAAGLSTLAQLMSGGKTLAQALGLMSQPSSTGEYQFPFGKVLGGLLESYGAGQQRNDLMSYLDKSLEYADPFHSQRPQYQTQFRQLTQDPSNFFKDPAISRAIGLQQDATSRKLASQGYNMSGNFATDVAQSGMDTAFKQYMPYTTMISNAAGAQFGPGQAGQIAANTGGQIAGLDPQIMGGLGSAFQSILSGSQPSYLEQIFGTQRNQNLAQLFMNGIA